LSRDWLGGSGKGLGEKKKEFHAKALSHALHVLPNRRVLPIMWNRRRGFTLIELIIVMAIILILGAIAMGQMGQQLMLAHETAAVQQIKTIHTAEAQYYAQFGRYAASLAALGPSASKAMGPEAAGLIPENLAGGKKSGYLFEVGQTREGYAVTASPEKFGSSGRRSFYSDQTLLIRNAWTAEPATVQSPPIE
jgi:type IV pilus assembly protein PilA